MASRMACHREKRRRGNISPCQEAIANTRSWMLRGQRSPSSATSGWWVIITCALCAMVGGGPFARFLNFRVFAHEVGWVNKKFGPLF